MQVQLRLLSILQLDGYGWSASRPHRLNPKEIEWQDGRSTGDLLLLLSGIEPSSHRHAAACRPVTAPAELPRYNSSVVAAALRCSIPDGVGGFARTFSINAHRLASLSTSTRQRSAGNANGNRLIFYTFLENFVYLKMAFCPGPLREGVAHIYC